MNTRRAIGRLPLVVAATAMIMLAGCGDKEVKAAHTAAATTTTLLPNQVSFKGVRLDGPYDWTVVQASSITACPPDRDRVLIVGDLPASAASADCAAAIDQPRRVWVTSQTPGLQPPSQRSPIGSLQGWQQDQSGNGLARWIAVLPQQQVEITFEGNVGDLRQQILASVKAG